MFLWYWANPFFLSPRHPLSFSVSEWQLQSFYGVIDENLSFICVKLRHNSTNCKNTLRTDHLFRTWSITSVTSPPDSVREQKSSLLLKYSVTGVWHYFSSFSSFLAAVPAMLKPGAAIAFVKGIISKYSQGIVWLTLIMRMVFGCHILSVCEMCWDFLMFVKFCDIPVCEIRFYLLCLTLMRRNFCISFNSEACCLVLSLFLWATWTTRLSLSSTSSTSF